MIREAPFLEKVELVEVMFEGIEPDVQPAATLITPGSLRSMVLRWLDTSAQAYILLHIRPPPCCNLSISEYTRVNGRWDAILHPLVALQLGPLSFSLFRTHPRYIHLAEQGSTQRCQVSLTVVREVAALEGYLDLSAFDMSGTRTLDIDDKPRPKPKPRPKKEAADADEPPKKKVKKTDD